MASGRTDFLPLSGTDVGVPLAGYLNGINGRPFQAPPSEGGGGGDGGGVGLQPMATSPFTPPSLPIMTKDDPADPDPEPLPAPTIGPKPGTGTKAPVNPWDSRPGGPNVPGHGGTTVVHHDGQTQQGGIMWLLNLLMHLGQQQRGHRRQAPPGQRPGHGMSQDRSGSPLAQQAQAWLWRNQFDPGRIGSDNTPGAGAPYGFGGFQRNGQPVGYAGFMRGGRPSQTEGGMEALARMTGRDPNSIEAWLSSIYRQENQIGNQDERGLFGLPQNRDPLFGAAPRYGSGAGDAWREWFSHGEGLSNMDRMFSGDFGGGNGSDGGAMFVI